MTDFIAFYNVLLSICGGLAAIWGVVKIVKEIRKPGNDLAKQVSENSRRLDKGEKRFERGEARMEHNEDDSKMIMRCLLALLNHEITGNDIKNLRHIRDELTEYITKI